MEQFTNCIAEAYMSGAGDGSANSLRQISEQFGITLMKTRKILITAGVYHTELSDQVISLKENGKSKDNGGFGPDSIDGKSRRPSRS